MTTQNEEKIIDDFAESLTQKEFIEEVSALIKKHTPNLSIVGSEKQKTDFMLGIFLVAGICASKGFKTATKQMQSRIDELEAQVKKYESMAPVALMSGDLTISLELLNSGLNRQQFVQDAWKGATKLYAHTGDK